MLLAFHSNRQLSVSHQYCERRCSIAIVSVKFNWKFYGCLKKNKRIAKMCKLSIINYILASKTSHVCGENVVSSCSRIAGKIPFIYLVSSHCRQFVACTIVELISMTFWLATKATPKVADNTKDLATPSRRKKLSENKDTYCGPFAEINNTKCMYRLFR